MMTMTHQGHQVWWKGLIVLLFMLATTLPAWSSPANQYQVEIVVFESLNKRVLRSEHWPRKPGGPSVAEIVELENTGSYRAPDLPCPYQSPSCQPLGQSIPEPLNAKEHDFHLLPTTEHRLAGVVKTLEASGQYRPLIHLAWQQPALSRKRALAVRIAGGWPPPARVSSLRPSRAAVHYVDGTFLLYRGRYLHGLADLVLYHSEPAAAYAQSQQPAFQEGQQATSGPPQPSRFRLHEHRRMRSGELHYLDHPLFGLLVQVTPYHEPESSVLAPEDDEPQNEDDSPSEAEDIEPELIEGDQD